jgi:signal transduction histidine kinase
VLRCRYAADLPEAYGDVGAVTQILDNILSNAIKYSPPFTHVDVLVTSRDGAVLMEVQDQGPGFSSEDMQRLYQKFARLSAQPTAGESSTGLGLSIVKKLVEAMNGTVRCESQSGEGARFTITLPAIEAEEIEQ